MARFKGSKGSRRGRGRWSAPSLAGLLLAGALLAVAAPMDAAPRIADPHLSATLVGPVKPGAQGRLAVRWDGEPGARLDAWVDLDGNGVRGPGELVVDGRPLAPGIEVVGFEVPHGSRPPAEPRAWVDVRAEGRRRPEQAVEVRETAKDRDGCAWRPGFVLPRIDGYVEAMTVFDDGSGPALYAGGEFTIAGGVVVNGIARWDGTGWFALSGPSGTGTDGYLAALAVFDDGSGPALYAAGHFYRAGGVTARNIARWDGSAWSALGASPGIGQSGHVFALSVFDDGSGPALYVGGSFATADGVTVNNIARWDGTAWSALAGPSGTGTTGDVRALSVFNDGSGPALYAGGWISTAGGVTVNHVARWDGTTWSALIGPGATGTDNTVLALAVFDDGSGPALYVGGSFTTAGGVAVNSIARWNGAEWSALNGPSGVGVDGWVGALVVFEGGSLPALYVGGWFLTAGGVTVDSIARWDGATWSSLGGLIPSERNRVVRALAAFDDGSGPSLCAGGTYTTAVGETVDSVARWDGTAWIELSGPSGVGTDGSVGALAVFDDGSGPALFAGGLFQTAGDVRVNNIARFDGTTWSSLSGPAATGTGGWVSALAVFDGGSGPELYAGGSFATAGGVTVNNIARWDGTSWSALGGPSGAGVTGGYYPRVTALAVFDDGSGPALYVGGYFTTAGGVTVNNIARWDGTTWSALSGPSGVGADGWVASLAVFDDGSGSALYAGGYLTTAGGVTVNNIARWDSFGWQALSGPPEVGTDDGVFALATFHDGSGPGLYAGGYFTTAGGVTVSYIARWDGASWSPLTGPAGTGTDDPLWALTVFDEGSGPGLYAGGSFQTAGGVIVNNIARWDGIAWSPLSGPSGTGTDGYPAALAVFDAGSGATLYAGGAFNSAGGLQSNYIAAWHCPSAVFDDDFELGDTSAWTLTVP